MLGNVIKFLHSCRKRVKRVREIFNYETSLKLKSIFSENLTTQENKNTILSPYSTQPSNQNNSFTLFSLFSLVLSTTHLSLLPPPAPLCRLIMLKKGNLGKIELIDCLLHGIELTHSTREMVQVIITISLLEISEVEQTYKRY